MPGNLFYLFSLLSRVYFSMMLCRDILFVYDALAWCICFDVLGSLFFLLSPLSHVYFSMMLCRDILYVYDALA